MAVEVASRVAPAPAVGTSVQRRTARAIVTGAERYLPDHSAPGELWVRIVRSQMAHAEVSVDVGEARRAAGVVATLTAADLAAVPVIPMRVYRTERAERALQPVIAGSRARYVGEPLAVIVARSQFEAEDAAEAVRVDYRQLPVVAGAATADPIHPGVEDNVVDTGAVSFGEATADLLREADVTVERTFHFGRQTACPIETRGLLAIPQESGGLELVGWTKVKQFNREALAQMLGLDASLITVLEPAVGGSFGVRGEFYPEDFLVPYLARELGAPVKWVEDRDEHFLATNHARESECQIEAGISSAGELLAIRAAATSDLGAYVRTNGLTASRAIAQHLAGPYEWAGVEVTSRAVLTNKAPAGTYRGPGAVEATFFRERVIDELARAAGIDPMAVRRKSTKTGPGATPLRRSGGDGAEELVVESGDPGELLDYVGEGLERGLGAPLPREAGAARGAGAALFLVEEGYGPADEARVRAKPEGGFLVEIGAGGGGQGMETALAQIAADALGAGVADVEVSHRSVADPPAAVGTFASRTTVFTGSAVWAAAGDYRDKAVARAAAELGCPGEAIDLEDATYAVRRDTGERVELSALDQTGTGTFDREVQSAVLGAAGAVVSVNEATLEVEVERLIGAFDAGRAINPALVEDQLIGAMAQGVGGALHEALIYDDSCQPIQATLMDYRLPLATQIPALDVRVFEWPATNNPLGAKGAGEQGIIGIPAAIANAVAAALGVPVDRVPVTLEVLAEALGDPGESEAEHDRGPLEPPATAVEPGPVAPKRPRMRLRKLLRRPGSGA